MLRHLAATAALSTLLWACGKKEPAPVPAPPAVPTEADAAPKAEGPTADATVSQDAPADPVKLTAAPAPTEKLPALVVAAAPPERAPLTPSSLATFPADIVAVGGTPSLKALVEAFTSQVKRVDGVTVPPDPLSMAVDALKRQAGVDLTWLDTDKPLRFAVPDPKKYPNGLLLLLPEKAGTAFDPKSIPNAKTGGGHLATIEVEGKQVFFDRAADGHVLVTTHEALAQTFAAFAKELAAWTPKDPLVLDTSVENLVRIFGDELKSAKEMVGALGGTLGQQPAMAGQLGPLMEVAATGFALVEGTSRMSLSLDPTGDFPRIGFAFKGLAGGPLDKIIKDLVGHRVSLAGAVPADAWLVMGLDVPGVSYLSDAKSVVDAITNMNMGPMKVTWTEEDKKTLLGLFGKLQEAKGSQSVSWFRQDGTHPFVFESVSDAKDGVALDATLEQIGNVLYKKLYGEGRKVMLAQGAPAGDLPEDMSFKDFIGLVSKNSAPMGFGLAVNEAKSAAGTSVAGLEVKIDWARLPLRGEMAKIGELVGDSVGVSLAGEAQRFAAAFGSNAAQRTARILDATQMLPEITDPWLAKAKESAIFLLFRPARLLRALIDIVPELAEKRAIVTALPDDPFVVSGASDGTTLVVEGVFPAKILAALALLK